MKNKILYGLAACVLMVTALYSAKTYAAKVLFFTPTRVELDDQKKVEVMNITNLSDITRAYKVSFQDQVMTYEGYTASVDNFEYSAKRMLRFVPREFALEPGERQTIRIMSRLRPDTAEGEYHTHVRFLEDVSQRDELNPQPEGQASISAPLAYEALIPAIISHGNIQNSIDLKDAKISKNPETGKYDVNLVVTRTGNGQGIAYVDTSYIAPNGEASSVTPRRTVYIYREITERKKDYDFVLPEGAAPGGSVKVSVYGDPKKGADPVKEMTLALP